jgi:hypothetical protein
MARVADKVPLAGQTKSVTSTDVGSPRESEAEDSSVSSKNQLRTRVYSLLREVAHVPLSSPPRLKKTSSIFETTEEGSFLTPLCHKNQIRYFLTRSGNRDPMASFQRRNPGRNDSQ